MTYDISCWAGPSVPPSAEELADRYAITQLSKIYALGMDMREYSMSRSAFTDDATARGSLGGAGIDEYLPKVYEGAAAFAATQHNMINQFVEFTGPNEARLLSYAIAVHKAAAGSDMQNLTMGVHYRDKCRRTDKGWLIYEREAVAQWTETSPAPPAK